MEIHDYKPNFKGWQRVLAPLRKSAEGAESLKLKQRALIGAVLVGLFVLTPAWIVLVGWLFLRLVL